MSEKTKAQLLADIEALQKRLAELQAHEAEPSQKNGFFKKQSCEQINRLNLILQCIRKVNQLIAHEKNRAALIHKICDILTETREYSTAWIMLLDDHGGFLDCAESGSGKGFTPLLKELRRDNFPACVRQALLQPGPLEIDDPSSTCADCPITDKYPDKGRVIARLEYAEKIYGVLSVSYAAGTNANDEELSLFEEVAGDIAFALHSIKLEENIRQVMQNLQESEKYQKAIFETTPVATAIIEEDSTLSMVNSEFENLSGYSKEELTGKMSWTEFVAADDLERMRSYHQQRRIDPETAPKKYEFRFVNREGIIRNILLYVDLIPGTKQSVVSLLDITEREQTMRELKALSDFGRMASAETKLDELMFFIADQIVEVIPAAEACSIFFYDEERKVLEIKAWAGFADNDISGLEFEVDGSSRAGKNFLAKKPVLINNFSDGPGFKMRGMPNPGNAKSQISVPLIFRKSLFGIIYVDNLTRTNAFSQKDLNLLEAIGNQLVGTIENARLHDQLKERHKQLQLSEELYHSIVEYSPGLISRFLPDGTITFANQGYCEFYGKTPEELVGTNMQYSIPEQDREFVNSIITSLTKESPIQIFSHKTKRYDGKFHWMHYTFHAFFDDQGQMTSCQSFGQDVTELVEAEQAVRREKHRAQKYLDIAGVIFVALNKKGEITLINKKGNQLLGYQSGELIGRNWFDTCIPKRYRKEIMGVFKQIIASDMEPIEFYENPVLTKSGEERIIAWHNTLLRDEKGNYIGLLSSGEDISERVRSEQLLNALNRAAVAMGTARTQEEIFNAVTNELKQLDISCTLFPLDETQDKLVVKYLSHEPALLSAAEKLVGVKHQGFSFPIDAVDVYQKVVREKKMQFTDDPEPSIRQILPKPAKKLSAQIMKILRVPKSIAAPLIVEDQVIGVFSIQSEILTRKDIPAATAFASQLSSAWNKIRLLQDLRKTVRGTIHTIAATVEARDPYTSGHQKRVADLAVAIASEMKLPDERVEGIRMAGLIHDLGKIQIPAEILSKPGKLSELEYEIIKTHPQTGFDLLKEIEFPWPIAEMVRQHHEKMDGSGYPQGLKGDEIMPEARILAVADAVEAMSSHRPYRPALGIEKALAQIKKDKGTLFDPKAVNACLKIFKEGYKLLENSNNQFSD